jgi:Aspartate racemase
MTRKLAMIHTTPVTIASMKELAAKTIPGVQTVNFLDDSILPQLIQNGGNVAEVEERLLAFAHFAEDVGADVILSVCSSVGEVVEKMRAAVSIPVVRIDEAMAETALARGERIGVVATLSTTMSPTLRLLRQKAEALGKTCAFESVVADEAYRLLMQGDTESHDRIVAEKLADLGTRCDVIILAQASMARAVSRLPEAEQGRFLTSPELAMQRVKTVFEELGTR